MSDSTQHVPVPTTFEVGDSQMNDYDDMMDSIPEMNSSSEDESRNVGILIEHDDDYDDVWESSEHLLKLQTELDVLTSRARLVQSDRHCRRPKPSQRRVIEDYEEKWREQFGKLGHNGDTLNIQDLQKSTDIRGTYEFGNQHGATDISVNSVHHDYSEIPENNYDHDYSEIPENSDHHEYSEIPENSDHHDYSEIPQNSKPEDV